MTSALRCKVLGGLRSSVRVPLSSIARRKLHGRGHRRQTAVSIARIAQLAPATGRLRFARGHDTNKMTIMRLLPALVLALIVTTAANAEAGAGANPPANTPAGAAETRRPRIGLVLSG